MNLLSRVRGSSQARSWSALESTRSKVASPSHLPTASCRYRTKKLPNASSMYWRETCHRPGCLPTDHTTRAIARPSRRQNTTVAKSGCNWTPGEIPPRVTEDASPCIGRCSWSHRAKAAPLTISSVECSWRHISTMIVVIQLFGQGDPTSSIESRSHLGLSYLNRIQSSIHCFCIGM